MTSGCSARGFKQRWYSLEAGFDVGTSLGNIDNRQLISNATTK